MRARRLLLVCAAAFLFSGGLLLAVRVSQPPNERLLIDTYWWFLIAVIFAGLLAAAFTKRKDPEIRGDEIYRHDEAARWAHWTHGVGTLALIVSGVALGFFFIANNLAESENYLMFNVHFIGAVPFLFGTSYYFGNALLAVKRVREHLPTRNAVRYSIQHYKTLLPGKYSALPPEEKYFESEKVAYVMAVVSALLLFVTGIVKSLGHAFDLPAVLLGASTIMHDIAAVIMILFFVAHVFFAAIAPGTRPLLVSMITGFMPLAHAKKEHSAWVDSLCDDAGVAKTDATGGGGSEERGEL